MDPETATWRGGTRRGRGGRSPGRAVPRLLAALLLLGGGGAEAASLVPTGNTRHAVRGLAGWTDGVQLVESEPSIDTLATAPFDDAVEATESTAGAEASGRASLRSELSPNRIEAIGSVEASASASGGLRAAALGSALFRYEFTVDEATPYELSIVLEGAGAGPYVDVAFLEGSFGPAYTLPGPGLEHFRSAGVLHPGTNYFLSASTHVSVDAGDATSPAAESGFAAFDVRLAVPEPALGLLLAGAVARWRLRRRA